MKQTPSLVTEAALRAELAEIKTTRGVLAAIRTLRRRGMSLPLALLHLLRLGRRGTTA
jgi:hypothetical protein